MKDDTKMRRRDFLVSSAFMGSALSAVGQTPRAAAAEPGAARASNIVEWEAVQLADAIRTRKVSCEEVMRAHLAQIKRVNSKVNAIIYLRDENELMQEARARDAELPRLASLPPLYGFPHAVKDLESVKGMPATRGGAPLFKTAVGESEGLLVQRLRAAGVIIIGKTNAPEFGLGSHTVNRIYGATTNPYNSKYSAGGSSGGAGAALSMRMVPVADGSDFGGSLRNPAGWNNVCGFRTSIGRIPSVGGDLWSPSMSVGGPMARTVTDVGLLLSVLAGPDKRAPLSLEGDPAQFRGSLKADFKGTKIGWLGDYKGTVPYEPGVVDVCKGALKRFETLGCSVEETAPNFDVEKAWQAFVTLRAWGTGRGYTSVADNPAQHDLLNAQTLQEVDRARTITGAEVSQAAITRSQWTAAFHQLFDKYDYVIAPTAQLFPFEITKPWPTEIAGQAMRSYHEWMKGVCLVTMTGCPSLGVPAGFGGKLNLPMGLQIIAPYKQDLAALKLGAAYEAVEPLWRTRAPKTA